eukprot:765359-Hanusia_phi.AAC.2
MPPVPPPLPHCHDRVTCRSMFIRLRRASMVGGRMKSDRWGRVIWSNEGRGDRDKVGGVSAGVDNGPTSPLRIDSSPSYPRTPSGRGWHWQ